MATLLLGVIGASVGSAFGAAAGLGISGIALAAGAGNTVGSMLGGKIDGAIFNGKKEKKHYYGPRLTDTSIQSMGYGFMIPITYGTVKIAGNIIWADQVKEHVNNAKKKVGRGKKKMKYQETTYSYTTSVAIAICKGEIADIDRIWADDVLLEHDRENIRIYKGTREQLPDKVIKEKFGIDAAPAYRDLAYVIFENIDLTSYGNRLPNFTFEVRKKPKKQSSLEDKIQGIVMIPGSGEFVYDTIVQKSSNQASHNLFSKDKNWFASSSQAVNQHHTVGKANAVVSLENLEKTLPNLKWVSVAVNWFVDSLDLDRATVYPAVEFSDRGRATYPEEWSVASYNRKNTRVIGRDKKKMRYGGTVNDSSLVRYIKELKNRGYKVMLYPMLLVDQQDKPWRGRITGSPKGVKKFFSLGGYGSFIKHYAHLGKDMIDAFAIGSEMVAMNKIRDENGNFVAVDEFVNLAEEVRKILGDKALITYAADWSEYHHSDDGWYHLDKLWASPHINFVGIDSYFPLTELSSPDYSISNAMRGWESGEGYDYYYSDHLRKKREKLDPPFAWKNIKWWWENYHVNPDGKVSPWVPKQKKIWFTEYGFPSVDLATNQPNVFFDKSSIESAFPRYSKGSMDIISQRVGIEATEDYWKNSPMVENKMLWCWDARPYPSWPHRADVWSDSQNWSRGHWVQGKLGVTTLADVILELCHMAGLGDVDIDVSQVNDIVDGLILDNSYSVEQVIEMLQGVYHFDIVEKNGKLHFLSRKNKKIKRISAHDVIYIEAEKSPIALKIGQEFDLPGKVSLNYFEREGNYRVNNYSDYYQFSNSKICAQISLPMVLSQQYAKYVVQNVIYDAWAERLMYEFVLPAKYIELCPADVIKISHRNREHIIRLTNVDYGHNKTLRVRGISENPDSYVLPDTVNDEKVTLSLEEVGKIENISYESHVEILDLRLPEEFYSQLLLGEGSPDHFYTSVSNIGAGKKESKVLVAACGKSGNKWGGCRLTWIDDESNYETSCEIVRAATMGILLEDVGLPDFDCKVIDYKSRITVAINSGDNIENVGLKKLFNHYNRLNYAVLGEEIIAFSTIERIEGNIFCLKHLLRGLFGTEKAAKKQIKGNRFILLDDKLGMLKVAPCMGDNAKNVTVVVESIDGVDFCDKRGLYQEFIFAFNDMLNSQLEPSDFGIKELDVSTVVKILNVEKIYTEPFLHSNEILLEKNTANIEENDKFLYFSWLPRFFQTSNFLGDQKYNEYDNINDKNKDYAGYSEVYKITIKGKELDDIGEKTMIQDWYISSRQVTCILGFKQSKEKIESISISNTKFSF